MRTRKESRAEERLWEAVIGLIAEKTGETKGQVLERIADRAQKLQRRRRASRQSATNHYALTPTTLARVGAKPRT